MRGAGTCLCDQLIMTRKGNIRPGLSRNEVFNYKYNTINASSELLCIMKPCRNPVRIVLGVVAPDMCIVLANIPAMCD